MVDDRPGFLTDERFPEAAGFVHVEGPEQVAKEAAIDRRTHVGRDDAQLPARQGVPAVAARFRRRLHRHARPVGAHASPADGARRRGRRDHRRRPRAHPRPGGPRPRAPRAPRRSRRRSSPRSSPPGTAAAAASSRNAPARSTTARRPAPKRADGTHRQRSKLPDSRQPCDKEGLPSAVDDTGHQGGNVSDVAVRVRVPPADHDRRGARPARLARRRREGAGRRPEPDPDDEAPVRRARAPGRHQPSRGPRCDRGGRRRAAPRGAGAAQPARRVGVDPVEVPDDRGRRAADRGPARAQPGHDRRLAHPLRPERRPRRGDARGERARGPEEQGRRARGAGDRVPRRHLPVLDRAERAAHEDPHHVADRRRTAAPT